uniref:Uncharacterized protein n=1 Tax=Rhizophora mucronata TaxID=61149 RepID=A0A2P2PIC0_RHIMU
MFLCSSRDNCKFISIKPWSIENHIMMILQITVSQSISFKKHLHGFVYLYQCRLRIPLR